MDFDKLGGRRFTLTFVTMISTTILTGLRIISGEVYATVIISIVGAMIAGHTTEQIKAITSTK